MPTTASIRAVVKPMIRELRVPCQILDHRSWPMWLVPNQKTLLGFMFLMGIPTMGLPTVISLLSNISWVT